MIKVEIRNSLNEKVRPLHGMNLAAPITHEKISKAVSESLGKINVPLTRMHDAPLNNAGMRLVDIPCVFPFFHADHNNPENYFFDQTDDYFANAFAYGTKIMYRLGVSIELSKNHYWTKPPEDYVKWAEICIHIIEHYPNIEYYEIWNEADAELPLLWDGTWDEYINFYITTSKIIKSKHPEIKIGGPSMTSLRNHDFTYVRKFLTACRDQNAPLDFFTYHQYSDKPEKIIATPLQAKELLNEFGFDRTEIHLAEWRYHPGWGSDCTLSRADSVYELMMGVDSAVYTGAVLTGWQDTPLTMGEYYTGSTGRGYALFYESGLPTPVYYVVDFFNQICRCDAKLSGVTSEHSNWIIGGQNDKEFKLLLSSFKTEQNEVCFDFGSNKIDPSEIKITVLDHTGTPHQVKNEINITENSISFEKVTGSAAIFIEGKFC